MIIECPTCQAKVDAKKLCDHTSKHEEMDGPYTISLLICSRCSQEIFCYQEGYQIDVTEFEWSEPSRLWPNPESYFDANIPDIVRTALYEARLCYKAQAYNACAVMCGKAIEGICRKYGIKRNLSLEKGLKKLAEMGVIDGKILKWGEEVRLQRNIGAHPSDENITPEDAQDLLDFAVAISEYVFVLSEKFEKFIQRKNKSIN